jgi:hypothetical protein
MSSTSKTLQFIIGDSEYFRRERFRNVCVKDFLAVVDSLKLNLTVQVDDRPDCDGEDGSEYYFLQVYADCTIAIIKIINISFRSLQYLLHLQYWNTTIHK